MGGAHQLEAEVGKASVDLGGMRADRVAAARDDSGSLVLIDGVLAEEGGDPLGVPGVSGGEVVAQEPVARAHRLLRRTAYSALLPTSGRGTNRFIALPASSA